MGLLVEVAPDQYRAAPPGQDCQQEVAQLGFPAARRTGDDHHHWPVLRDSVLGPGRQDLRQQGLLVLALGQDDRNDVLVSQHHSLLGFGGAIRGNATLHTLTERVKSKG
ncbi:hypothetical protein AB0C40_34455 [Streptomyces brevispora]|uniref:hypothetical protein n=1 Tax=Streptomyces brevispora TaxID=887462 RepID=UPI0033CCA73F